MVKSEGPTGACLPVTAVPVWADAADERAQRVVAAGSGETRLRDALVHILSTRASLNKKNKIRENNGWHDGGVLHSFQKTQKTKKDQPRLKYSQMETGVLPLLSLLCILQQRDVTVSYYTLCYKHNTCPNGQSGSFLDFKLQI